MASLRRFNSSLDVVAARSSYNGHRLRPSGTDHTQEMTDSTPSFSRSASAGPIMKGTSTRSAEPLRTISNQPLKARSVPPLNVKKLRRRALISGVALVLPESPILPPTTGSIPSTSFTFTANWDSTLHEFSFTPVSPHTSCPSPGLRVVASPIPYDVEADVDDVESSYSSVHVSHPRRSFSTSSFSSTTQSDSLFSHSRNTSSTSTTSTAPSSDAHEPRKLSMSGNMKPPPITVDLFDHGGPRSALESSGGKFKRTTLKAYDNDALSESWSAFEQSCWDSLDQPFSIQLRRPASCAVLSHMDHQRKSSSSSSSSSSSDKALPDVPVDCSFFDENDLSPLRSAHFNASPSLGRWMRARFHKLFGSTHRHPS